ncbi:MAG TPA: (Fe-S)-binding protein, partial [Nitrososphaerales archaeon]|nr:(Fe-S)-binding protein [Nitrososphaerales archaeon]
MSQVPDLEFRRSIADGTLSSCYQCGTCTAVCPMNVPVRSIMRGAQVGIRDLAVTEALWQCATCRQCEVACPRGVDITGVIHALRGISYGERKVPAKLEAALWRVYEEGTAWEGKKNERAKWAEGLDVKVGKQAKHLLYLDDAASFDPRLQSITRSLVKIFKAAGVDFAVLGDKEKSSGDEVYQIGEEGFLEELAQSNIDSFKSIGAEDIITVSPHSNGVFREVYPKYGSLPPVLHYTEFLSSLLDHAQLKLSANGGDGLTVTYHDPCYLGRYGGVYEEPRKLLESIPGARLSEMDENRSNALCCGGGGGGMFVESEGERPSHRRVS